MIENIVNVTMLMVIKLMYSFWESFRQ